MGSAVSLPVPALLLDFATPKRIGLRSYVRLSAVLLKSSPITSLNISTHLYPSSKKLQGWTFAETSLTAISRYNRSLEPVCAQILSKRKVRHGRISVPCRLGITNQQERKPK